MTLFRLGDLTRQGLPFGFQCFALGFQGVDLGDQLDPLLLQVLPCRSESFALC